MPKEERPLLTPAQWLVLERLAAGDDNAAIGLALGISPSTVASHLKVIYQRLPYVSMGNKRMAAACPGSLSIRGGGRLQYWRSLVSG